MHAYLGTYKYLLQYRRKFRKPVLNFVMSCFIKIIIWPVGLVLNWKCLAFGSQFLWISCPSLASNLAKTLTIANLKHTYLVISWKIKNLSQIIFFFLWEIKDSLRNTLNKFISLSHRSAKVQDRSDWKGTRQWFYFTVQWLMLM